MRNLRQEKAIKKIDREIEALRLVAKYLSNKDEIIEVRENLNGERQILANDLYYNDSKDYIECCSVIRGLFDKELGKDEQKELLDQIKEIYGRNCPNVSKDASGLNGWLKELDIEYTWVENLETEWSTLIITGFAPHN